MARLELLDSDGYPRLSTSLLAELTAALESLLTDPACAGIVLHGSEKCFAVGAEIAELASLAGLVPLEFSRRAQLLFEKISRSPKPVVAAVAGYCLGGGFDLALACHLRLASPEAVFGHPGATLGLLTGWGGTQRLPRLLGRARALELLLSGESIATEKAFAIGLVQEVVATEELIARALLRARNWAKRERSAMMTQPQRD